MFAHYRLRAGLLTAALLMLPLFALISPAGAQEAEGPGPVTIHADNTSAAEILEMLAERSGLNIVTTEGARLHNITIHLREAPFDEALNVVVRAAGLAYERVGNSIVVAEAQSLSAPGTPATHVFDLQYADAVEVARALTVLTDDVAPDVRANQVVMRGGLTEIEEAADIVASMDRKPLQVLLEARLIEISRSRLQEIGIDWEEITKWTTVISEGKPDPSQIGQLPNEQPFLDMDDGLRWTRQAAAFEVTLDALIAEGSARMLSNSKVVTVDGQAAEIFAGETVPVIITSLQTPGGAGGVFQTVQLEKIDVGVRLNITPRVGGDGLITTLVEPEVSRIVAFVGPDDDLPQTSTRRARTLVRVKDGQKIYLGGLLSEETRKTVKRVPLLGHIPLLGYFFQYHRDETVRLDLLIEITPHIVGDEGAGVPTLKNQASPQIEEEMSAAERILEMTAD
jgi:type II secretory pathway component GspD/PulD (secretin)